MRRMLPTILLIGVVPLLLTACFHSPFSISAHQGFEAGFGAWKTGADVPEDPNNPGNPVEWSIEPSAEQAAEGAQSARLFLDGLQDDGTIWLARSFDVPANAELDVSLSFQL